MKRNHFWRIILAVLLSIQFNFIYAAQPLDSIKIRPLKQQISPVIELQSDIAGLIDNPDFSNAFIGICVQSLETGEFLYKKNDMKNFIPASNLKLFTTAAALHYLGKDFRYSTKLYLDGETNSNGEFKGNLIIRGNGDPSISKYYYDDPLQFLDDWALKLDSAGIRSIKGNIIGDDSYFDDVYYPQGWAWDDMPYAYSAQVDALAINDNIVNIKVDPAVESGESARITMSPENSYVRVNNYVVTSGKGQQTNILKNREAGSNIIDLAGTIMEDSCKKCAVDYDITVNNPTLYFLHLFKQTLENHNIRFRGALLEMDDMNEPADYTGLKPIAKIDSPTLDKIIKVVNSMSHNLAAEMLLKTMAKEMTATGSFDKGVETELKYLAKIGIAPEKIALVDGSGLSRLNIVSPRYVTTLLQNIYQSEDRDIFMASLALPGKTGTLKKRMTGSRAEDNIRAKTGTMNSVSSISGYATTRDGEALCFSIIINGFTVPISLAQNLQDLICMRLASFSRKK